MKWNFRLKALLKFRSQLTDEAMGVYAEAKSLLDEGLSDLDRLYQGVDDNFKKTQSVREGGGLTSSLLTTHDEFFAGQQVRIENQKKKVRELKEVAEEKYEILVEKTRDLKAIEKLEEKDRESFLIKVKKDEQKKMDDIIVMRGKRGRLA